MPWKWIIAALWFGPAIAWVMWKERRFSLGAALGGVLMAGLCGPLIFFLMD